MSGSKSLQELSRAEYWDSRYSGKFDSDRDNEAMKETSENKEEIESFEWFKDFQSLEPFFTKHLPQPDSGCRILHLGCGNSTLTADLHDVGYRNQISVDFSEVVIGKMKEKFAHLNTDWCVADVRDMKDLKDDEIDIAIDKGTLDAMIHGSLWDPPEEVKENVGKYVDEVARVLKSRGQWLYITYRQPHFMRPFLSRDGIWTTDMEVLGGEGGAFEYFGWIMKKL